MKNPDIPADSPDFCMRNGVAKFRACIPKHKSDKPLFEWIPIEFLNLTERRNCVNAAHTALDLRRQVAAFKQMHPDIDSDEEFRLWCIEEASKELKDRWLTWGRDEVTDNRRDPASNTSSEWGCGCKAKLGTCGCSICKQCSDHCFCGNFPKQSTKESEGEDEK